MLLCVALVAPLITAGCANRSLGTMGDLRGDFSERSVTAAIDVLARAGVAVYEAPDSREPVRAVVGGASPLRFTRWQARNLALQVSSGGGYLGSQLDAVIATPKKAPSFSFTLAAWITRYNGAGAKLSKQIMPNQDWKHPSKLVFSALVLALFLADATRSDAKRAGSAGGGPLLAMIPVSEALTRNAPSSLQIASADPCSAASSFLHGTVNDIVASLQITSSSKSSILEFLKFLWNLSIRIVGGVLMVVISNVLKPLTEVLQGIATVLGVVTQVVSALHDWKVGVLPHGLGQPKTTKQVMRFQVDSEALNSENSGNFTATIDTGSEVPWPGWLAGCAAQYGVDLSVASTADSTVSWRINSGIPELARETYERSKKIYVVDGAKEAYFLFAANKESPEVAANGKLDEGVLSVEASVTRLQLEKLKILVENLFLAQLPHRLAIEVYPYFKKFVTPLEDRLIDLINHPVDGAGAVLITFHNRPTPISQVSPTPGQHAKPVNPCALIDAGTAGLLGLSSGFNIAPPRPSSASGRTCMAVGHVSGRPELGPSKEVGSVILIALTDEDLKPGNNLVTSEAFCVNQLHAHTVADCYQALHNQPGGAFFLRSGVLVTVSAIPVGTATFDEATSRAIGLHALDLLH